MRGASQGSLCVKSATARLPRETTGWRPPPRVCSMSTSGRGPSLAPGMISRNSGNGSSTPRIPRCDSGHATPATFCTTESIEISNAIVPQFRRECARGATYAQTHPQLPRAPALQAAGRPRTTAAAPTWQASRCSLKTEQLLRVENDGTGAALLNLPHKVTRAAGAVAR